MKLLFVDETGDDKFKDYLGICVAIVDASHYGGLKDGFQKVLRRSLWNESIEFKGQHIFSASKGDTSVDINQRVAITKNILRQNIAKKNARMTFHFGSQTGVSNIGQAYLESLPQFLEKVLPKPVKGGKAKNLIALTCDFRNDVAQEALQHVLLPVIEKKRWQLYEQVTTVHSNFHTVGILYADIVGYLAARIETISNDAELFENIPPQDLESNGKYKKLRSSSALLNEIKNMNLYRRITI